MTILYAVLVLAVLGALFGFVLAIASKKFAVPTDERLEPMIEALPGANCGGCGYAGCAGYARAVLAGEAENGKCVSGGSETAAAVAAILGEEPVAVTRTTAFVQCAGFDRKMKGNYEGLQDCLAATRVSGNGPASCGYGCLGYGTCVQACTFDAMHIVDGHAVVDREKCTGCMACAAVCPRHIIISVPYEAPVTVLCANKDRGAETRKVCDLGCIGCTLCEKVCRFDAIHIQNNLAVIDYDKCTGCGECAAKCPRHIIAVDASRLPETECAEPSEDAAE